MKLTAQQIIDILEANVSVGEFAYNEVEFGILGLGEVKEIEQIGGEGKGDHWHSVKYFKDHDVYLKVIGWYQSHYGTDFESWEDAVREVKPQEKTITVYE